MQGKESIILIPGLFGFARIGDVDYFAAVSKLLTQACQIDDITALVTPPTGSLWRRVDALHRCVITKIHHGASRVHLIGHSTGGVDARLLVNSRYLWPGGPSLADRTAFFDRIGAVIPISAPQKGTPIARRLRGLMEGAIPALFLASFAAKYDAQHKGGWRGAWAWWKKAELHRSLLSGMKNRDGKMPSFDDISTLAGPAAKELWMFLEKIVDDHPLIHELTPYAMKRLNDKLLPAGWGEARELPVSPFVTVAPPPAIHGNDFGIGQLLTPVLRGVYGFAYEETRLEPNEFGPLPKGPFIGNPKELEGFASTAQDGVVPAASQSLDGRAEALVYGDHLDVMGHYPSAKHGGETVFDSGANFDDARMEALWNAVGQVIVRARTLGKEHAA